MHAFSLTLKYCSYMTKYTVKNVLIFGQTEIITNFSSIKETFTFISDWNLMNTTACIYF